MSFLNGKKTYIIAACTVIGAVGSFLSGSITADQAIQLAITAVLGATIRHGVTNEVSK